MITRIFFLDNLRTFMILLVILYHAGFVYTSGLESNWIVVDEQRNESIGLVGMYLDLFVMFTLFFISGYFIPKSLQSKSAWGFITSKFKRIMFPWIVAVFTLIPAYKMIFLYSRDLPQEAWYTYFHFFERTGSDLGFYANKPLQGWLWFLPVLFFFQLLYLGLSRMNLLSYKISLKNGVILSFFAGLLYSTVITFTGLKGWFHSAILHFQNERLLVYFAIFLLGSICYKLKVFETGEKNKKLYITTNVVLSVSLGIYTAVALNLFFNLIEPGRNYFFISEPVDRIIYYSSIMLSMLSFLYILLSIFKYNFNKTNKLAIRLNQNSYYVYVIHMVVIGLVALLVNDLSLPVFVKYLALTALTFAVSNVLVSIYYRLIDGNKYYKIATIGLFAIVFFSVVQTGAKEESDILKGQIEAANSEQQVPETGIHEAVVIGDFATLRQHLKVGTDPDQLEPSGGSSPLITASVFGKTEAARLLIDAGANVNFRNKEGSTPLHSAAFFCNKEIVEILLESGADTSIKNNAEATALQTVSGPYEDVKGIYDYFEQSLGQMGLSIDHEQLRRTRPIIAELLLDADRD